MDAIKLTITNHLINKTITMFVSQDSARNIMRDKTANLHNTVCKEGTTNVMRSHDKNGYLMLTIRTSKA